MHVLSLFIRTCLVWFIIFLVPPFETSATQETKLKSQHYYADGIQLSQAKYWKEAADEFRKAIQVRKSKIILTFAINHDFKLFLIY